MATPALSFPLAPAAPSFRVVAAGSAPKPTRDPHCSLPAFLPSQAPPPPLFILFLFHACIGVCGFKGITSGCNPVSCRCRAVKTSR